MNRRLKPTPRRCTIDVADANAVKYWSRALGIDRPKLAFNVTHQIAMTAFRQIDALPKKLMSGVQCGMSCIGKQANGY